MSDSATVPAAAAPEMPGSAPALPAEALKIASGYAFTGPALDLGALLRDGTCLPDAQIRIPLPMLNRHGLVAGSTGTGKTKTLQLIAEQLSAQGVPVFLADIKGDVSGLSAPGVENDRVRSRVLEVHQRWTPSGFPAEFYAPGGLGHGIPTPVAATRLRAPDSLMGPVEATALAGRSGRRRCRRGMHRLWTGSRRTRS